MLNKAEGIFYQIKEAEHLTDNIRFILGLPILGSQNAGKMSVNTTAILNPMQGLLRYSICQYGRCWS